MVSKLDVPVFIRKLKPNLLENCKGKFVVAEFLPFKEIESMTIEAIPGYWLEESATPFICPILGINGNVTKIVQSYIFAYIPLNQTHNIRKIKMDNRVPDLETWVKWPINFVLDAIFDNYLEARQEEVKVEAYPYSDLDNYIVQNSRNEKRSKVNKKKWPSDTSTAGESDSSDVEGDGKSTTMLNKLDTSTTQKQHVPKKKTLEISVPSPPLYCPEDKTNNDGPIEILEDTTSNSSAAVTAPEMALDYNVDVSNATQNCENDDMESTLLLPFEDPPATLSEIPVGVPIDMENVDLLDNLKPGKNPDDFHKACLLRLLNQNMENSIRINKIEQLLQEINAKLNVYNHTSSGHDWKLKDLIPLPVGTLEELHNLNRTLKENRTYFSYLQNFMTDCCPIPNLPNQDSKTIKQELHKIVGHIYSRVMTNELAVCFNMCGRNLHENTPKKERFKQFPEILTVTFEAMKPKAKLSGLELNRSQSEAAVGEWLRQAKNRMEESKAIKRNKIAQKRASKCN